MKIYIQAGRQAGSFSSGGGVKSPLIYLEEKSLLPCGIFFPLTAGI
jgi:hypothetical protein